MARGGVGETGNTTPAHCRVRCLVAARGGLSVHAAVRDSFGMAALRALRGKHLIVGPSQARQSVRSGAARAAGEELAAASVACAARPARSACWRL